MSTTPPPDDRTARPRTVTALHDGNWWWIGLFSVVLLLLLGVAVGVAIGGSGSETSTEGLRNDRLTHLVERGDAQAMLDQHAQMLQTMRAVLSPQMQQYMDTDPMWKLMRNGEYTKMLEDQQEQIDRMLGKGAP